MDFTNLLVQKFGLPDYVRTGPRQVRFMRMFLIRHNPIFMGQVGESISPEMSPLQAVHLLLEVLGHKFYDPEFQLKPEVWEQPDLKPYSSTAAGAVSSRLRIHRPVRILLKQRIRLGLVACVNPKESEIRSALVQKVHSMNPLEAFALIDKALEVLGIQR